MTANVCSVYFADSWCGGRPLGQGRERELVEGGAVFAHTPQGCVSTELEPNVSVSMLRTKDLELRARLVSIKASRGREVGGRREIFILALLAFAYSMNE